jgi:hypothetical protein
MAREMVRKKWFGLQSVVTIAAVLWFLGASAAAAQSVQASPHCAPVGGTVATNFIDQTTTLGVATGDLRGAVSATLLGVSTGPNDTVVFSVQHHWVTEAGDTIVVSVAEAVAKPVANGLFAIVNYPVTIVGGTGRFKGATGTVQNIGEVDLNVQRTVFRYHGEVCFSASK